MAYKMNSPFQKKMGKFKDSDAPDAEGKFKKASASRISKLVNQFS